MNEEERNLQSWVDPELEASIVALVLGEASDFEAEKLEKIIGEKPELAVYRTRIEQMYGLLSEVAAGGPQSEGGDSGDRWTLPDERKNALLTAIGDGPAESGERMGSGNVSAVSETRAVPVTKGGIRRIRWRPIIKAAAVLFLLGALISIMTPSFLSESSNRVPMVMTAEEKSDSTRSSGMARRDPGNLPAEPETGSRHGDAISEVADPAPFAFAGGSENRYYGYTTGVTSGLGANGEPSPAKGAAAADALRSNASSSLSKLNETMSLATVPTTLSASLVDKSFYEDFYSEPEDGAVTNLAQSGSDGQGLEMPDIRAINGGAFGGIGHGGAALENPDRPREESRRNIAGDLVVESRDHGITIKNHSRPDTSAPAGRPSLNSPAIALGLEPGLEKGQQGQNRGEAAEGGFAGASRESAPKAEIAAEGVRITATAPVAVAIGNPDSAVPMPSIETRGKKAKDFAQFADRKLVEAEPQSSESLARKDLPELGDLPMTGKPFKPSESKSGEARGAIALGGIALTDTEERNKISPGSPEAAAKAPQKAEALSFQTANPRGVTTERLRRPRIDNLQSNEQPLAAIEADEETAFGRKTSELQKEIKEVEMAYRMQTTEAVAELRELVESAPVSGPQDGDDADGNESEVLDVTEEIFHFNKETDRTLWAVNRADRELPPAATRQFQEGFGTAPSRTGASNPTDLNLAPEAVEFDGFISYGTPIEPTREFIYPTEYNPPEIPNAVALRHIGDWFSKEDSPLRNARDESRTGGSHPLAFHDKGKAFAAKQVAPPAGLEEKNAADESFSTFSLHVSDVSFKLAQAALAKGEWPEAGKVRIEEFVNALDYGDPNPTQDDKVACNVEQTIHPFLQQRNLMRVAMRTAAAGRAGDTPLRLTFLLDNSGSMERADREETVRRAFALLADQLQPIDQVTLISFARQPRLLADKVSGDKSRELVEVVANLPSEGGTNLEAALKLAFEKAQEQKVDKAQNRIVLLTDGAANLGNARPESLAAMIESMREEGIAFDAAGIGADGLNDEILEALTRKGDGRYYLLDRPEDADDGFARQIAGALRPAAKNVKVQVEFNPDRVGHYKLLGFEKHRLKKEDFRDDSVDAAEMAAEEAGVAVYQFEARPDGEGDVGFVSVRFRDMSSGEMVEKRWPIPYEPSAPRPDQAAPSMQLAAVAALFAAKLNGEPLGDTVELEELAKTVGSLPAAFQNKERVQQLRQMIEQVRNLAN